MAEQDTHSSDGIVKKILAVLEAAIGGRVEGIKLIVVYSDGSIGIEQYPDECAGQERANESE